MLSLWFLSQGDHRVLVFNRWLFELFFGLPKTPGPVLQWNTIGALLVVVIPPLFVFAFFNTRKNLRIIALVLCLFFTGMLFFSDSGAGWLAFIIGLVFILVYWRRWLFWVLIPVAGLLSGAAAIFHGRTKWLSTTFSTTSIFGRIRLWENTFNLLKGKAAVMGLGLGNWFKVYNSHYNNVIPIVHDSFLQIYCDTGVFGFIAMVLGAVIFMALSMKFIRSSRGSSVNWIGIGLIGSIIAGAVFAIFDVTTSITYVTDTSYIYLVLPLFWIGVALVSVATRLDKVPN